MTLMFRHRIMSVMLSVTEVASHTGLSARRVRALIAAGTLPAVKVGAAYVLDERDLDDFLRHERPAHTRALAPRIAWAAAALLDGVQPTWLRVDELSRLRSRLAAAGTSPGVWQVWTARLADTRMTFKASSAQVEALLASPSIVCSGRSASNIVTDLLVGPVSATVWTHTIEDADQLRRKLGLLRSTAGNVVISSPPTFGLPALGADGHNAFRLVVARDLLAENEPRASAAGAALLATVIVSAQELKG